MITSIPIPKVLQDLSDFCTKNNIPLSLHGESLGDIIMESLGKYHLPENFIYECLVICEMPTFLTLLSNFLKETSQKYTGPLTTIGNVIEACIQQTKFKITCGIDRNNNNSIINITSFSYKINDKKFLDYEMAYKDVSSGLIAFSHHFHPYIGSTLDGELFENPIYIIKLIRLYCKYNKINDFLAKQNSLSLNSINKNKTYLQSLSHIVLLKQFCQGIKESHRPDDFIQLLHSMDVLKYILPYKYNYISCNSSSPIIQIAHLSKGLWIRTKHKKDFIHYLNADLYWSHPMTDALYFLLSFSNVYTIEDIRYNFSMLVNLREKLKKDYSNIDELLKEFTYNSNCIVNKFLKYERSKVINAQSRTELTNLTTYSTNNTRDELEYSIFKSKQYK